MKTDDYNNIKTVKEAIEIIAEQDRRIGMLTRKTEHDNDTIYKLRQCQDMRKEEAGYEYGVSFDIVWAETLKKAQGQVLNLPVVMPRYFKERRQRLNMSMQDVTDKTDISKATISRIERGQDAFYKTIVALDKFYSDNGA